MRRVVELCRENSLVSDSLLGLQLVLRTAMEPEKEKEKKKIIN